MAGGRRWKPGGIWAVLAGRERRRGWEGRQWDAWGRRSGHGIGEAFWMCWWVVGKGVGVMLMVEEMAEVVAVEEGIRRLYARLLRSLSPRRS